MPSLRVLLLVSAILDILGADSDVCPLPDQGNLLFQKKLQLQKNGVHVPALAGNVNVDQGAQDFCRSRRQHHAEIKALQAAYQAVLDDKIWLFVQSGPHTGSTLLYEAIAGFGGTSMLCRTKFGHHAETQTQLFNFSKRWPNWKSAWDLQAYIGEGERSRTLVADNMTDLAPLLEGLWLHPTRRVRATKSPAAVYFTEALEKNFGGRARFIFLVLDPYVQVQHLRQTYFRKHDDDLGYKGAMHMVADIFKVQHEAVLALNGSALVLTYEDFTEKPGESLQRLQEFLPEMGEPPETTDMVFTIHKRVGKIKNMNGLYLKALSQEHRAALTQHFLKYEDSITFFGYTLDGRANSFKANTSSWLTEPNAVTPTTVTITLQSEYR